MKLLLGSLVLALSLSVAPAALMAQQSTTKASAPRSARARSCAARNLNTVARSGPGCARRKSSAASGTKITAPTKCGAAGLNCL